MGNCLGLMSPSTMETSTSPIKGEEKQRRPPANGNSSLLEDAAFPLASTVQIRRCVILPSLENLHGLLASAAKEGSSPRKRTKITLTRKQLELLLSNAKFLNTKGYTVATPFARKRRWRPALATIPESLEL